MTDQVLRGAFDKPIDELILQFVASIECDKALIEVDITGSLAHVWMLEKTGVLSTEQAVKIRNGLLQILDEGIELKLEHEDVHMNIEKRLQELIGDDAKLLHTARSRNDQVALDLRLFVAKAQTDLISGLKALCQALVEQSRKHHDVIMPGYTHLQRAQPVLLAHVLLSFAEGLTRDIARLQPNLISPLGAGALAGTAIPINPSTSAQLLGAKGHFTNSIDAVSDRDFAVEFVFACSLTAVHLSQLAENLILWCTSEFGFIKLPDELTTGSSIMPQKKNPDCLELVRGKAGMFVGELVNLLTTLKALPFGYNRDLQETKPPVVRTAQTLKEAIAVCTLAIAKMEVCQEAMFQAASDENLLATDIAEFLVKQGVPFREAHSRVAALVKYGKPFSKLTIDEWQQAGVDPAVVELLNPLTSVTNRNSPGGTSPIQVQAQLLAKEKLL